MGRRWSRQGVSKPGWSHHLVPPFEEVRVRGLGCFPVVISDRRRITCTRVALAIGATLLASLVLAARAPATPHVKGAALEAETLQEQVIRLFDRLDQVSGAIDSVRADVAFAHERITELSRQIDAQQDMLDRHAAEAYMSGPAVGVGSLLGASSFTDLQDALEFLDAVSEQNREVLVSLQHRKAEVEEQRVRLEALEANLRAKHDRLETTVTDLIEKLERQQDLLRQRAEEPAPVDDSIVDPPAPPAPPDPPLPSPVPGREAVMELIRDRFAPLGSRDEDIALCVAERESGFDPRAENPYTGAAGVFQFLPSTWASLSEIAGWGGASVFDARANVAVAAWTVAHYGWHPWRSSAEDCGT